MKTQKNERPVTVPVSGIVPTRNRAAALARTLESLHHQDVIPEEIIIVDASDNDESKKFVANFSMKMQTIGCRVVWQSANIRGAAAQRNQAAALATKPVIAFFDDDIIFEPKCFSRLWQALQSDARLGGVNAMVTNQSYHQPGLASRIIFRVMAGEAQRSYAGRVLGPGVNLLPDDRNDLPDVVAVEWLNLGCTLYRREALPNPPFSSRFTGYSMMEDLTLSLTVGRSWKLANVRTSRIYHDSQPGEHKADIVARSRMELVNRHFVMADVLGRRRIADYAKLMLWEGFQLVVCAIQKRCGGEFWLMLWGKIRAFGDVVRGSTASGLHR